MRYTGVTARGIITPIFKEGDDLAEDIVSSVITAADNEGFALGDRDILGVTESVVARTQGNYATCEQIAADIRAKFGGGALGLVFPILSRNRFAIVLKAIAMGASKVYLQLSYPFDELGNALVDQEVFDASGVNPHTDNFTEREFRAVFGRENTVHRFTGVDYIKYYKSLSDNIEIVFSNDPAHILQYTKNVVCCDVHTRFRTQRMLQKAGADICLRLDDLMTAPVQGSGYNETYGLIGFNKSTEDKVKLFPRNTGKFVEAVAALLKVRTGKDIEVLVYGDGAFKDPAGGIWELADPVVSPAYTKGLASTPNEIKIKYLADNDFAGLSGDALTAAMKEEIAHKEGDLTGNMKAQGTTPRPISDLVGSLCDLVSGSGDKGTPVVLIQGYFSNLASW